MFSKKLFSISVFPFAEALLPTWLNLFRLFLLESTFTLYCGHRLTCYIASFARFPDSCLCFIPLLSSGISTLVVSKSLLMMCNSYLVQFLKTHVCLTMSSFSLICQEDKTCLYKLIMFCSCCLVISFGILIYNNKYIEIMLKTKFSK